MWISFGTPCSGIFLPVYLDGVIPAALARGGVEPQADSAWWTLQRLQQAAASDPPRHTLVLRKGWREFEERIETEQLEVEKVAREAVALGERDRAAELVSAFMAQTVDDALELSERLRSRIADPQ